MDEKYQRIKVLGKGSFGKAYLVRNTEADELCVVKQMETSMMNPKERSEAVKEATLLKRMDHKNIVKFQDVFMTRKGRLCIVMEYADGGDVHMEIKRREGRLLQEPSILEWFVQTCFALKHVHDRKVLHRDLKTQNIFLMSTGQIKLGDFGIARVLDATKDYARTMVGTPYYLSPEIIEDSPYNSKSDVWSIGVVLYEMTTLRHPFDADSLVILASKILKDQYPPPDASYSSDLVSLIQSMLSKKSSLRPSIRGILCHHFLQPAMHQANNKYGLELDLSEFAKPPPPSPAASEEAPSASAAQSTGVALAAAAGVSDACAQGGAGDTVLIGSVRPGAAEHAGPEPTQQSASEQGRGERKDESDYEEEFEDYSGSEDGDAAPPSALTQSVRNLKLAGPGAAPASRLSPVQEGSEGPGMQPSVSAPVSPDVHGSRIVAKADSLRSYLQSQVPGPDFERAYSLVRSSGELGAEEVQRQVAAVIGDEKAPELFTLFQLLCFLEDVSVNATGAPVDAA